MGAAAGTGVGAGAAGAGAGADGRRNLPGRAVLQSLQPAQQRLGGGVQLGGAQLHKSHLQLRPLVGVAHLVEGFLKGVQPVEDGGKAQGQRLACHHLQLLGGAQHQPGGVLHGLDEHQPPEVLRHLLAQAAHVLGFPVQAVNGLQGVGGVLVDDVLGQSRQVIPGGHPRRLVDNVQRHVPVPAQTLVQQGEGVPQGAVGHPGDAAAPRRGPAGRFPAGPRTSSRPAMSSGGMRRKSNRWQRERMVARKLVHLCGGQDENHMARAAPPGFSAAR